eukprot:1160349-Pelagomonas_calceolata.AAC.10
MHDQLLGVSSYYDCQAGLMCYLHVGAEISLNAYLDGKPVAFGEKAHILKAVTGSLAFLDRRSLSVVTNKPGFRARNCWPHTGPTPAFLFLKGERKGKGYIAAPAYVSSLAEAKTMSVTKPVRAGGQEQNI